MPNPEEKPRSYGSLPYILEQQSRVDNPPDQLLDSLTEPTKSALQDLSMVWPHLTQAELINHAIQQSWCYVWDRHRSPAYQPTERVE